MSEVEEKIRKNIRCCACGASLLGSMHINVICLDKLATWKFPSWGNVLVMNKYPMNRASAILCDRCIEENRQPKHAIEWSNDYKTIRYHKVGDLRDLSKIPLEEVLEAESKLYDFGVVK